MPSPNAHRVLLHVAERWEQARPRSTLTAHLRAMAAGRPLPLPADHDSLWLILLEAADAMTTACRTDARRLDVTHADVDAARAAIRSLFAAAAAAIRAVPAIDRLIDEIADPPPRPRPPH
jgi:hypothetical protein